MSLAWLRLADLAETNREYQPPVAATAVPQSDPGSKC
jgi:hypothetical protein